MLIIPLYKSFLDKYIIKNVDLYLVSSWILYKSKFVCKLN